VRVEAPARQRGIMAASARPAVELAQAPAAFLLPLPASPPLPRARPTATAASSFDASPLPAAVATERVAPAWAWAAAAAAVGGVAALAATASQRRRHGRSQRFIGTNRIGRTLGVARRAVDLPVREAPVETTVAIPGAKVEEDAKQKKADQYRLLLFNDPLNKREFVARCLMTICLLKESDAYQVMMKAHKDGVAIIGTYQFETAEAYCEGLKAKGLTVDIIPLESD